MEIRILLHLTRLDSLLASASHSQRSWRLGDRSPALDHLPWISLNAFVYNVFVELRTKFVQNSNNIERVAAGDDNIVHPQGAAISEDGFRWTYWASTNEEINPFIDQLPVYGAILARSQWPPLTKWRQVQAMESRSRSLTPDEHHDRFLAYTTSQRESDLFQEFVFCFPYVVTIFKNETGWLCWWVFELRILVQPWPISGSRWFTLPLFYSLLLTKVNAFFSLDLCWYRV